MLDKQYHLYSVDTGHFYSGKERYLHNMNCRYRQERNYVKNKLDKIESDLLAGGEFTSEDLRNIKNGHYENLSDDIKTRTEFSELCELHRLIIHKREKAKDSKTKLLILLKNKVEHNISSGGKDHIRNIDEKTINDTNVVSMFDSFLSRTLQIPRDTLTDNLIIVQVYYFDVFKDIMYHGFTFKGEKYRYFTSSAGQIRKKKAVFIKESVWDKYEKTLMCGLTIGEINRRGGINVNKFLAYLALSNSAGDEWKDFDIDKCIVIEDFETQVKGSYDFIDDKDFSITRKTDFVPIPHTDGAGMLLPNAFGKKQKNTMFRMPFVKGLLCVFDFRKFILENENDPDHPASRKIKDIYGKEWDIFEDDIQIILSKSQFKLYKYFLDWQSYKDNYKKYNCTAGRCNIEEDRVKNSKINYQMLQTLIDITDKEIDALCQPSADRIKNVCQSKETMLDILGATSHNPNMSPFQQALKLYPALLSDTYSKDVLRDVKNSLLKKYRSGKLEVKGKYCFALPDFYAACEFWFCGIENPDGLLGNGEVFCWTTRAADKVDCLRSPHLYCEHAIRKNIAHRSYEDRMVHLREWFVTGGVYTSTHDLISKILQLDVDGDMLLIVSDRTLIEVAERTIAKYDIVPLYYNMSKALPVELNPENVYKGLVAAFTGGNIGIISNDISKIWNSQRMINGTEEEKREVLKCIKWLCCYNNFVIDYAKCLYKPVYPENISAEIKKYTNSKLPAFFEFAKDKTDKQVCGRNNSFVNQIYKRVKNINIDTSHIEIPKLDFHLMMNLSYIACDKEVAETYDRLNRQYRYMLNMKDEYVDNLHYVACQIRKEFEGFGYSTETIVDMLVQYLYGGKKRHKQVLWFCYGQYIVNNLKRNLSTSTFDYKIL